MAARFQANQEQAEDARKREVRRERVAAANVRRRPRNAWRNANRLYGEVVPFEVWVGIWSGTCFDCGKTPAEGVDHVLPRIRGGRNMIENLQPACTTCNLRKGPR